VARFMAKAKNQSGARRPLMLNNLDAVRALLKALSLTERVAEEKISEIRREQWTSIDGLVLSREQLDGLGFRR